MKMLATYYNQFITLIAPLHDVVLLLARFWLAKVFFMAGLSKLDSWETTLLLFENEYAVPFIPYVFAAYSATFFELIVPPLLVLGLFTRLAVLPLLAMTAVIEFTYGSYPEHAYWALLLGILMTYGAGRLSLDYLIKRKCADGSPLTKEEST